MSSLRDLYQELILDHNKNPKNFGTLKQAQKKSEGYNPLCGDHYFVELNEKDAQLNEIAFSGSGCALSKASASLMTEAVKETSLEKTQLLIEQMLQLVTGETDSISNKKLQVFKNVQDYPSRVKCAALPWHTLKAALEDKKLATTE